VPVSGFDIAAFCIFMHPGYDDDSRDADDDDVMPITMAITHYICSNDDVGFGFPRCVCHGI